MVGCCLLLTNYINNISASGVGSNAHIKRSQGKLGKTAEQDAHLLSIESRAYLKNN